MIKASDPWKGITGSDWDRKGDRQERELRKEFEAEIRKADAENVRLQMEVEQLKKQSEK